MACTGSSTSSASMFQIRKAQLELRARVTESSRFSAATHRLSGREKAAGPRYPSKRRYQANTAAVSPAVGPYQRNVSARSTQKHAVIGRNSRSREVIS